MHLYLKYILMYLTDHWSQLQGGHFARHPRGLNVLCWRCCGCSVQRKHTSSMF